MRDRASPPPRRTPPTAAPATVLVFRDQHKQEVQNYAIVGQTLWIFSPQRTQKIPLAEVDLDATRKPTTSVAWISACPARTKASNSRIRLPFVQDVPLCG